MIRVVLVDDQALIRSGIRALLDAEDDIEVVAEGADGLAAVQLTYWHYQAMDWLRESRSATR